MEQDEVKTFMKDYGQKRDMEGRKVITFFVEFGGFQGKVINIDQCLRSLGGGLSFILLGVVV